jgi:rSAM/selenodomain-associated transferase 2
MTQYIISIIIPVLNEAAIIEAALPKLQRSDVEVIVVDGGSSDSTAAIAQRLDVKVVTGFSGRAAQMNAGANIAQGNILLFLHGDTQLPPNFLTLVTKTLAQPNVVAGAFELAIEGNNRSLRLLEVLIKMRSHFLSLPYGDQAIFIFKQLFVDLGGFSNLPIMEDFELIQRLKRQGKVAIAPAVVITSGRRWHRLGIWQTTLINQLVIAGYYLGISPHKLNNFYRSQRGRNK